MHLSIICQIIGLLSTALHGVLLVFYVSDLVQLPNILRKDSDVAVTSRLVVVLDSYFFALELALCIASIILVIGIRKERTRYMAAWIYLAVMFLVSHLLDLLRYSSYIRYHLVDLTVVIKTLPIVLMAAFWYPVFKLWRQIIAKKKQKSGEIEEAKKKQQANAANNEQDAQAPMLYPNLEENGKKAGDIENSPEKQNLYPSLP